MKLGDALLLISRFALGMAGSVFIGVGAALGVAAKGYLNFLPGQYLIAPVFIIILGTLFFLTAFFRIRDSIAAWQHEFSIKHGSMRETSHQAWEEKQRSFRTLVFFLFIVLIGNISAGIASFVLRDNMYEAIKTNMHMQNGMTNYTATWDLVQENFKCCGLEGKDDWKDTPESCCVGGKEQDCGKIASGHGHELYEEGCLNSFTEFFRDNLYYVGVTAFCVAAVEVLLVICVHCGFLIYILVSDGR